MRPSVAKTWLSKRFGNRTGLDADIERELVIAQEELDKELIASRPWFLLSEENTATSTIGEERVALPSDFLQEAEPAALAIYDESATSVWDPLTKGVHDTLRSAYTGRGRPVAYATLGKYFRLAPVPDAEYTLKLIYYQYSPTIDFTGDVATSWLQHFPRLICSLVGMQLAEQLRDDGRLTTFVEHFASARRDYDRQIVARDMANHEMEKQD